MYAEDTEKNTEKRYTCTYIILRFRQVRLYASMYIYVLIKTFLNTSEAILIVLTSQKPCNDIAAVTHRLRNVHLEILHWIIIGLFRLSNITTYILSMKTIIDALGFIFIYAYVQLL